MVYNPLGPDLNTTCARAKNTGGAEADEQARLGRNYVMKIGKK